MIVSILRRLFFKAMFSLVVVGFFSTNGIVCADGDTTSASGDCGKCDGKITELTLQYNGTVEAASIKVVQKKVLVPLFNGDLNPGDEFTFRGLDFNGTMGTKISIFVDDILNAKIHTSCSKPIGPGLLSGDFQVIEGYSLNGGLLCPANNNGDKPGKAGKHWKTRGNDNINPDVHFLGTINPTDLVIKTNSEEQMRVTPSGNVGIGDTMPQFKLSLDNDGGIIARGEFGSGNSLSTSGEEGARLIWYPRKAAFRAGRVTGTAFLDEWDDVNIGDHSTATGNSTKANGDNSTAIGNGSIASGESSTAMGNGTTASGDNSTATGNGSTASGESSTALGSGSTASGENSTALGGNGSTASGDNSTATGNGSIASGFSSTAMGNVSIASGGSSTAMGNGTTASGGSSTAMGNGTEASGGSSTAMGNGTKAIGFSSTAMGNGSEASGFSSTTMGIGTNAQAYASTVLGRFNVTSVAYSKTTWEPTDPLFVIGNGSDDLNRDDAFIVLKNGTVSGPSGTYHAPSDKRLKKNIVTIQNALEKVSRLRGVNFKWKDSSDNESLKMGMVAQEVEEVVPEVVHTADDEMKTKAVEYAYLVGLLVEAVKELKAENDTVMTENQKLRETLTAIADRQEALENMFIAISTTLTKKKLVKYNQAELDEVQKTIQ